MTLAFTATEQPAPPTPVVSLDQNAVLWRGRTITLSARETEILSVLASPVGRHVSHLAMMREVYGWRPWPTDDNIRYYICRLRRIIAENALPFTIETKHGVGWRLLCGSGK